MPEKRGLSLRGNEELIDRKEIRMNPCHALQSKGLAILILLIVYSTGCSLKTKIKHDPFYKSFYEKARIIMTEEEIKIYNLFSDKNSKQEFIENFWKIRDPNPSTVENEALSEFQRRIAYANVWFDPFTPGTEFNTGQGWNTDRGRIYLIFGEPDKMVFGGSRDMWIGGRNRASDNKYGMERWYYFDYGICIFFLKDEHGKWKLVSLSQQLLEAMETAKLNMVSPELRVDVKRMLKFKGEFENNRIILRIPTQRILLAEKDERLHSRFKVKICVYRNHKRIEELDETLSSSYTEDEILRMKFIRLEIPYSPPRKGEYLFDITLEDMMAISFSRYRNFIKHEVKN